MKMMGMVIADNESNRHQGQDHLPSVSDWGTFSNFNRRSVSSAVAL